MPPLRTFFALTTAAVAVASCLGGDSPTGEGGSALVSLALQPALIPSPANSSALPINRIRAVVARESDGVILRDQRFDVSPTATSWALDVETPASGNPTVVIVYLYLLNVASDGVESVQFSGRTPPTSVKAGDRVSGIDADIVRGPIENLAVTAVQITAFPASLLAGASGPLSATVTTSGNTTASVFWTSLDPGVVTLADSVATGVAAGTAEVVASAGAHADTVSIVVVSPVDSVRVSPDSADVTIGATLTYAAELRDAGGTVLTGRPITWTTGNTSIATVTAGGVVTGVAAGTTTVRATSEGVFDVAVVRVVPVSAGPVITWTRNGGGSWSDPTAWSLGRVPQAGDTVRLTQGNDYAVSLDVNASVAALEIGGTTDVIGLDLADRTLAVTGSFAGAELNIRSLGRIEMGSGILNARGIAIAGILRTYGNAWVHADSIWHTGTWSAASGLQQVAAITPAWISVDGTLDLGVDGTLMVGPNSFMDYGSGPATVQGTGLLWFSPGSTLQLHRDLVLDGPNLSLQYASIREEDSEDVIVGAASSLSLASSATQPAESDAGLRIDGYVSLSGPRTTVSSVEVRAGGTLIAQDAGSAAVLRTGRIDNYGDVALVGTAQLTFGPGDVAQILNHPGGVIEFLPGGSYVLNGELVNDGEVYVAGQTELRRTDAFGGTVSAQHVNNGLIGLAAAGGLNVVLAGPTPSSITNAGTIQVGAGTTLAVTNATTPASQIISTGTAILEGEGTVDVRGGVPTGINNGTIRPGSSPGVLTWLGSVPMGPTGTIAIELEGTVPGTGFDRLDVSADMLLNLGTGGTPSGNLVVTSPGFVPPDGSRYAVLTFRQRFGNFANVTLPVVTGVTFDTLWAEGGTADTLYVVASGGAPAPPNLNRWTGAVSTDWGTAGNWSKNAVPVATDSVVIDTQGVPNVVLSTSTTVDDLVIGASGSFPTLSLFGTIGLTVSGVVVNNGIISFQDNVANDASTILSVAGGITVTPLGIVVVQGSSGDGAVLAAEIDNEGTIWTQSDDLYVQGSVTRAHQNSGMIYASGGDITFDLTAPLSTLTNSGNLDAGAGRFLSTQGGTLTNEFAAVVRGDGTLQLFGTSFTNDGIITPGINTGILTVSGDYAMGPTSNLLIDIGGLTPGAYDQLNNLGNVTLGGSLLVTVTSFQPQDGDRFAAMTFAQRTGTFANVQLPFVPGIVLDTV